MLHLIILLHILCFIPANAFPQRNKPNTESSFDFDAYLKHFVPLKQTVNDYSDFLPNQDYRYIPLLGERLDYTPPVIHRGHFPHPNIPKRAVKHRSWHSSYQDSNFPLPTHEHEKKTIPNKNMMQSHKRELHQPIRDFTTSTGNFNFRLHPKMEDFGDYEAPEILEAIEKKEMPIFRQQSEDYDTPVVLEAIINKRMPDSIKHNNRKQIAAVPPKKISVAEGYDFKKPTFIEPSPDEDYDVPVILEAVVNKGSPISKNPNSKQSDKTPGMHHSSFSEDYDEPLILEAFSKVDPPIHNKKHGHKKPTKAKPIVNKHDHVKPVAKPVLPNYETPIVVEALPKKSVYIEGPDSKLVKENTFNRHGIANPILNPVKEAVSNPEDYESPIVLESFTKEKHTVHNKEHDHKSKVDAKPAINKHKENVISNPIKKPVVTIKEYYEAPIVVEALTKEGLFQKEHSNKKSNALKPEANKHGNKQVKTTEEYGYEDMEHLSIHQMIKEKPIVKPVKGTVSNSEVYESPIVLESFTKEKHIFHKKEHDHKSKVDAKPAINKHKENAISNPAEKPVVTSKEYYEAPIVVESFTKEKHTVHNKEHDHKSKVDAKPAINKHKENVISNPAEKPVVTSKEYYEAPIVVEALTKEGLFQKEHGNKKSNVMKPEANKHGNKQGIGSTEEPITEEYVYDESEHLSIHEQDEYDFPAVIGSEMHHDSVDYNYDYEDSTLNEDPQMHTEHNRKFVIKPPMKIPEIMNKKIVNNPSVNQETYETSKNIAEHPVTEIKKRIVKREVKADYEDYELPIVLESFGKTIVPKGQKIKTSGELKSSEYEQDYDAPIVLKAIYKSENPITQHRIHTDPLKVGSQIDYDYEKPVVLEAIYKRSGVKSHKPTFVDPTDYAYDDQLPVMVETHAKRIESPEPQLETGELTSKINSQVDQDYETPIVLQSFTKTESIKNHMPRPVVKSEIKVQSPAPAESIQVKEKPDAYNRNKREREHPMEVPKLVIARQDAYERPVDAEKYGYDFNVPQRPGNYFEGEFVPQGNPDNVNFESLGIPDNQIVLDSITINKENPDGREVPFLEVLAVEDKADGGREHGVKVMAFNKENGDVDVINLGHVDSNHEIGNEDSNPEIEDLDQGSGSITDERSINPRSFLPVDSNSWTFMNHIQAQERRKFKRCFTPRNETGNCMPVQMCPVSSVGSTVDDLLKNVCIIDEVFIGICCPEYPVETVHVDWGQFSRPDTEPLTEKVVESQEIKECGKLPSTFGNKDSWPWMAPLVSSTSDKVFCGGALVTEFYVLTAAHCTSRIPRNQILVRLGNRDSPQTSSEFEVVEIKRHAQYNSRTMQNDIALLKLSRRVPLGNFRKLICLPESDAEDYVGETAVLLRWQGVAGKGAVESLPVISNHDCQNKLGTLIGGSVLCTEARNDEVMCNADSGAPLVIGQDGNFKIVGVLTWNRNDCDGRFPSVFTRVSSYRKWIQTHAA